MRNRKTADFLRQHDNYLILNHCRPDGDAVGCAAALCRGLRAMGKSAWIWKNPQTTARYQPYLEGLERETEQDNATIISVDMATENLLPINGKGFSGRVLYSIDHHISNEHYAAETDVRPECAACGEVILELLRALEVEITKEIAEALYLAISTDTGCFQYSNVTPQTIRAAADLKETGINTYAINKVMFGTKSRARLALEAALIQGAEFYADGKVAVCCLTDAMMASAGATEDDADDISGFPRGIEGVSLGVMVREMGAEAKISLRGGEEHNASAICAALGGGGHKAAAGATVKGSVEEGKAMILKAISDSGVVL